MWASNGGARPAPDSDFWYSAVGVRTTSGARVSHALALQLPIVLSCVRAISEELGALPLKVFRRIPGGKEEAPQHPLYELLHDQPNEEQSAIEFREQMLATLLLRGTAVAEKIVVDSNLRQLIPLHPDNIEFRKARDFTGRVVWVVRHKPNGEPERFLSRDRLFIVRTMMVEPDSIQGLDPILAERDAIGAALAVSEFGERFFANDSSPPGVLVSKVPIPPEQREKLVQQWREQGTGANRHKTRLVPFEVDYKHIGITNEQAQFLETRNYANKEICRIFRVPPAKAGLFDDAKWANVEQQNLDWVTGTLGTHAVRFEQAVRRDLVLRRQTFFAEHNFAGLLRGTTAERYAAHASALQNGWLSINEIRAMENLNPIEGGDTIHRPMNLAPANAPTDENPPTDATAGPKIWVPQHYEH